MRVTGPPLLSPAFAWAFVANFLHSLALFGYLHLPGFLEAGGSTKLEIGVVVGTMAAAAVLMRPWVGRLLDTRGRRVIARWGSVLHVVVTLGYVAIAWYGLAPLGPWTYVIRVLHGMAQAMLFSTLFTIAADVAPPARRTEGIALFGVSGLLPMALAGLLGDVVLARGGYLGLFCATAAVAGLAALASWPLPDSRPPAREGAPPPRSFLATALRPSLLPLWTLGFAFAASISSYFTFLRTFIDHAGVGSMGLFYGVYSFSAIALRLVLGWVPDRVGPRRSLGPSVLAAVAGLLVLRGASDDLDVALAGALCGTGHAFVFPIVLALVVGRSEDNERGTAMAMFTALFDLGMLVGAPVLGAVLERTSYGTMFGVAAATAVAGLVAWAAWDGRATPRRG